MMSQQRQNQHMLNDTTYTKIFVGGLAWETQRETMRKYFEQFGDILEAVVITDKATGRSKGYGFVTFKDPEAAFRACQNPTPVIDGRRANCNLACLGASHNKNYPPAPPNYNYAHLHHHHQHHHAGQGRLRGGAMVASPPAGLMAPSSAFSGSSNSSSSSAAAAYFHQHQPLPHFTFPYSAAYGYSGFSHDSIYPLSSGAYYGVYGAQPLISPYYIAAAPAPAPAPAGSGGGGGGSSGYLAEYYPNYYAPHPYGSSSSSSNNMHIVQYHHHRPAASPVQMLHHRSAQYTQTPYSLPPPPSQHGHLIAASSAGILSLPPSPLPPLPTASSTITVTTTASTSTTEGSATGPGSGPPQQKPMSISDQNSSA